MKHLFLTMLLCGASFYSKAQSDDDAAGESNQRSALRMTLEQCIDYALGHNYEREATALNQTASHDLYRQSVMERRPDLSANVSENAGYSGAASSTVDGSFGLTSSLILFQGGQISGQIRKNKLVDEQSQLLTRQYDNMLVIEILHAFLAVVGGEELLNCQQSILEASAEQVKVGNDRYRLGEILESDFLLLESQFATDKNNLAQTAIERDNSLMALKSLLSLDPMQVLEVSYADAFGEITLSPLPSEAHVLESASASLPDLRISVYNVEIARTEVSNSRAGYFPTLSLNGSLGGSHADNFTRIGTQLRERFTAQAGITLSVPVLDRHRTKSKLTQSRISLRQAELQGRQNEILLRQTVLQEYHNVISSANSFETSGIKERAYRASLETCRRQFEAGSITTIELLQQQNNHITAVNDYVRDKYSFLLKRKILDVYMGEFN